jgi:starch phosphorylase
MLYGLAMGSTKESKVETGEMKRAAKIQAPAPAQQTPDPAALAAEILEVLKYRVGKDTTVATQYDWLTAAIKVVRDRIIDHWMTATKEAYEQQEKRVYYRRSNFSSAG